MAARRHVRSAARRDAVQILYQSEILKQSFLDIAKDEDCLLGQTRPSDYARELLLGVEEHKECIDGYLKAASEHWALERMPTVDRAILRLACYEMMYSESVPLSVTINEAVELAKGFGGEDDSHRFVNGVLGQIAKRLKEGCPEEELEEESKEKSEEGHER